VSGLSGYGFNRAGGPLRLNHPGTSLWVGELKFSNHVLSFSAR
jgi:hypothetical protein